jgi:hypothetical protein
MFVHVARKREASDGRIHFRYHQLKTYSFLDAPVVDEMRRAREGSEWRIE